MEQNQLQSNKTEKSLLIYLAQGLTKDGKVDVTGIDRVGVNNELRKYKDGAAPNYAELIKIPNEERICAMAERDMRGTVTIITVAITLAMEAMNLKSPMTPIQIVDLAEMIIDDSKDDKISIPDLLLFLQQLTRGKYGDLYGSIDAVKFNLFFNKYRDERWQEAIKIRDTQHEYYKSMGDANIFDRQNPKDGSAFGKMMEQYRTKAQIQRDERRERKNYNN